MSLTPPEKLAESIGHMCQTGCGRMADIVVVQLATGECDIQCQVCHLMMMAAAVAQLQESGAFAQLDPGPVSP